LHQTIKKVGGDIERFRLNTAVSQLMICTNVFSEEKVSPHDFGEFLKILAPYAPHLAEELWHRLGNDRSIHAESWPAYEESLLVETEVTIAVQVNGKVRGTITVPRGTLEGDAVERALVLEGVQKWVKGEHPTRVVYVPDKLLNLVL
jgi:leucyl-tRNA synthetase